jgi:PAS domain S-box-containing protein
VGKSDFDLPWKDTEAEHYRGYDRQVMSSGKPEYHIIETQLQADGRKAWVDTNKVPLRDGDGEVIGILGTFEDITDRMLAQEALRESESNLAAVLENSFDPIYSLDRSYKILTVNQMGRELFRRITGTEPFKNHDLMVVIPPQYRDIWRERYDRALNGERFTIIDRYRLKGGTHYIESSLYPIRSDGAITGVSVFNRDITERIRTDKKLRVYRQRLEDLVEARTAELRRLNQELEAFAYSVSHDLRAPLRAINGFTEILREDHAEDLDAEGQRLTGVIQDNTRKMNQLITDLLTFSRMRRVDVNFIDVDMDAMVRSVFEELTEPSDRERVDFTVNDLPRIPGDPSLLRQVWTNLVANALKFSGREPRAKITVSAHREPRRLVYTIEDNGAGFDMRYAGKLFGVFQRLHGDHDFPGTGVGLALVQRIVDRHGGDVTARGEVGVGAVISFSLPTRPVVLETGEQ